MFNLVFGFLLLSGDISCFIRIPKNVEFQNKDVTNVKISQGSRTKRSIGGLSHPDWYSLDLDVEGSNVHLHLFRNDDVMTDIPILKLEEDGITEIYSEDQEESVFYQDAVNGAFVVVQYNRTQSQHVFGIFHLNENNYILQKDARNPIPMYSGVNQFEVVKENQINFKLADFLQTSEETMIHQTNQGHHREKRAIDSNQVELFIVCDYSVYKFWYDQSDKTTASQKDTDADLSVRQYYAFLVNGMDAMYKNIQTTSYSISILFAGILIVKLVDNSTWTETTRNTSISPHTVNAELAISHFNLWINTYSGSLPNFDHAMLFTRYDLEWKGSTEPQGLVFTNSICGTSSQSIVEDKFNFIIITVASHLLGHSLNAGHDGDGNNCSASDAYIMAPSFEPQEGKTATHPWIFSNCSTDYFTTKIDELDGSNTNCMKTLGSGFDPTALTPYDQNLLGLKYDVDSQCKMVYGEESYFCRSIYENNYASICTLMYCRKPGDTSCYPTIAGDGTLCGNRKYCVSGVCTQDNNATEAKEECLYGDDRGIVLNEGNWTCAEIVERAPNKCESVHNKCCASCAYYFKETTESQSEKLNVFDTTTDESTTEVIPTTVPVQSTTSCAGDGTLNRTNAGLNRECGAYSGTGKCIISHSACTEISKTWQCKCVQGYAEKSGQCVKMPNGLFKDIDRTRTVSVSENAGESVLNVIFSEINGFESITNQEAKIVGSDAEHFEIIYPIQSRFLIKTKTKLTMLKYEITVIVSVQIDNVIVRDHVHIIVNVIRSTSDITRKTLVVLDGTLSGSTIGFICTSCIKQAVLYPKQDIFSVENDGSVNTTKNIDLDSLIGETTITYSKQYNITNKNDPSVVLAIIDLVITRRMFTKQLPDVSKIDTKVGQFDLHDKLKIENLGDTGFTINSDNYLLLGTNRLEYAESQKVEKTLQISIGDVSFNIEVEIEVLDANNNPPSFPENNEYNFKMIQSVYPDLIVGFVKAEDKDTKSRIFYTISPNDKLKINNDGVISIKSAFSTNENYTVKITASDGLYSEDVDVIFEIIPEQNLNKSFTGMVNENRSPGTFVTTASASGYKAYSFADYTARTNFKIDSNTGLITTVKELDREQQDRYRYTIVAHKNDTQSCTLVVIGEVTIRIGDVNDEPPVFAHPFYNATVPENETSTSLTMHVLISTTDKDINPSVLYSVVSPSDKFSINSITGEIKTIRVLDRETDPTYEITVRANDSVNSATATVTVQVLDKNDNEPKFSRHVPGFSVSENASIGTVVISISANDSDEGKNAEITYDLDSPGGFFKIDQTTGEIKLLRELDREKSPIHYITVYARDNGDNILSSTSTLTVTVTDINDNSPKFNLSEMTVSVEENNDCTTAILKLNATDADEDNTQNSQITYTIVSNDQDITIDNNGVLKCRQSFDFEQQRSHTVVIRASDNGKPPLFAEQNVTVNINDVNDNQPEFKKQLTNLTIRYVNGGSSISQIVEIVSATDRDSGENGMVTYNMSGTAASFLNIDPDRGIIRTNKGMVPINQQYTLTVIVKDKGDPPKQTSSNINVNFQAIQTQPVKFNQELLEFTISENNAIGNRIGSIRNNVLHPSGTNVLFEIIDTVSVTAFSINASTGIITSSLTLDREVQDNHEFVVKVKNSVNGEQSDLSVIRVEVEDENDEKPVFGRVQDYTYTISEHLDTGAHATADVEEITASDADIGNNAIIDFKIEDGGDCIKKFKLTTMAENKMAVSLNENVDYEKMKSCTFLVTAFNRYEPQMNSTVRAVVRIMDYNDNDPVFEGHTNNEYDIDIPEDTTINSEPIVIGRVTDADDRENKDVELKISDDCWFNSIKDDEQFSLKLKPSQTLDYDDGSITNKCVITANDKAKDENLRRSATATVNIRITDVNDNPPVFDKKKKYVNVPRDEEIDFIITTVVATDRDSGSNGNITYSLRNSAHSASFTINPSTGALKINAPLIAIEKDKITLTIIATDKGSPLLSDTMQVEINITDENPRPFFTKSGSVEIQEHNTLPDGLIEQVVAYDRKSGIVEICDCIYYIDTKRDDIFIERNTGKIKFKSVNGTLDREKETNGRVQFAVIAQDKDNPPKNSSNIGFVIEIKDINDNTPAFKNPELSFAFPQNAPDGYVFGKVHAEDPDVNPKTFYSINLTQAGDNLKTDVVHINQETGELTKHGNTTLTFTQDAKIEGFVAAWDSEGDTNSTSYARIIIKVEFDDKNKHTPTFDRNTYTGEIRWDSKAEKSILQVNATDLDKDVQGEVHYSIVNGNTRGFFNVDKDGVVYLQYLLDSSIGTGNRVTVNLTIKAEDRGIIPKYSHANVRVVITGINPGVCIQESDHNKQVVDLETERNSWSNALYGLVAALCVSIIVCCVLLYKWRTSIPSSGGEPFYKRDKPYAENPEYDDLSRRQTVQYSQSNQAFDPPAPHLDFHPGKDEYTRIEENIGETSPFRRSALDIEESPDYTPEGRRRHMLPAAYSFNPNFQTSR